MADQGAEGLLSPWLRKRRLEAAKRHLRGRILDFGCGSGSLAALVAPGDYLGVDVDETSLALARSRYPRHRFVSKLPLPLETFDSIVMLAVIEHVADPGELLRVLSAHLVDGPASRIVVSTPHPSLDWVHGLGASLGLFSRHANEEHEELLGPARLASIGASAGLDIERYARFLGGANQLVTFRRKSA